MSIRTPPRLRARLGMTITEAMIGMLVLSVAIGGALQATTVARRESALADDRATARAVLSGLAAQLEALPYADPNGVVGPIGAESGESTGGPSHWDDLDDAHGWSGTPTLAPESGWTATVAVVWVNPADPTEVRTMESGLKRITVEVRRGERVILKEVRFRARM
jgi:hypothetical protein